MATEDLNGKICLVLGAGGFIGRHLVPRLIGYGANVRVFGRALDVFGPSLGTDRFDADFTDEGSLRSAVRGADVVYHLISSTSPATAETDPLYDLASNLAPTLSLLSICCELRVARIVFASSGGTVYGAVDSSNIGENTVPNPISAYGISKLAIEKYLHLFNHSHGMSNISLRVSNPYGPYQYGRKGQGLVGTLLRAAFRGEEVSIWGGRAIRDYIYVEDVTRAFALAGVHLGESRVFNIGTGFGRSTLEVVRDIERVTGKTLRKTVSPPRRYEVRASVLDVGAAETELGWKAEATWDASLQTTWDWIRAEAADTDPTAISPAA